MILFLANPHAQGGRVRRLLPAIAQALPPEAQLLAPESLHEALDVLMHQPQGSRVVLIGGDGTFHRWLPALLAQQLQAGLVPLGSGNDLARALQLQRHNWRAALHDALNGSPQAMDTGLVTWTDEHGQVHHTPFASSLTCGLDSAVALRALQGPRWLRGQPRYLWATLKEWLQLRHWSVHGHSDTQTFESGPMLFTSVLNTPTYGSGMPIAPHTRLDDGHLHWVRASPFNRWRALQLLPTLLTGTHLQQEGIQHAPCRQLDLHCPQGLPLAADGEWLGQAHQLRVHVQAASLHVVTTGFLQSPP